jgi:hypothetical protein
MEAANIAQHRYPESTIRIIYVKSEWDKEIFSYVPKASRETSLSLSLSAELDWSDTDCSNKEFNEVGFLIPPAASISNPASGVSL